MMKDSQISPENFKLLQSNIDGIVKHLAEYLEEKGLPFAVASVRFKERPSKVSSEFSKLTPEQKDSLFVARMGTPHDTLKAKFNLIDRRVVELSDQECDEEDIIGWDCSGDTGNCIPICKK